MSLMNPLKEMWGVFLGSGGAGYVENDVGGREEAGTPPTLLYLTDFIYHLPSDLRRGGGGG